MKNELKNFLSAHEAGHAIAALYLGLKIHHVTLALDKNDNSNIKLKDNILGLNLNYSEIVAYYLASEKAVEMWWIKYSSIKTGYKAYQALKHNHSKSDVDYVDNFLSRTLIPDPMKKTIISDARHLIDNIFLYKGELLKPLVDRLVEVGHLTGEQIEKIHEDVIIKNSISTY